MSNQTLVEAMHQLIAEIQSGHRPTGDVVSRLTASMNALEAMPYPLVKELDGLLLDLEYAVASEVDGFQSDKFECLEKIALALRKVPSRE